MQQQHLQSSIFILHHFRSVLQYIMAQQPVRYSKQKSRATAIAFDSGFLPSGRFNNNITARQYIENVLDFPALGRFHPDLVGIREQHTTGVLVDQFCVAADSANGVRVDLHPMRQQITTMRQQITTLNQQNQELQNQIETLTTNQNQTIANLNNQVANLQNRLIEAVRNTTRAEEQARRNQVALLQMRNQVAMLQNNVPLEVVPQGFPAVRAEVVLCIMVLALGLWLY